MSTSPRTYYASCALGLEDVLEAELSTLGVQPTDVSKAGVGFTATPTEAMRVCLWVRSATRVLQPLIEGHARDTDALYDLAREVDWRKFLGRDRTFAVFSSVNSPHITHGRFAALRVKDAVVDQLRERTGRRPDVDPKAPDVPLKLVVRGERVTLARDLSGDSLHRRGWRPVQVRSPLNEALAGGLLQRTSWDAASPLCDPMCGSATFLVEAAHLAGDRAPGLNRRFAFERWPDTDLQAWDALLDEARERWREGRRNIPPLCGHDVHPSAVAIADKTLRRAEVDHAVTLTEGPVSAYVPPQPPSVVVTNPPYGVRLGAGEDLSGTYRDLGDFLKQRCEGAEAWVLSGDKHLTRHLRLRAEQKVPVRNGALDCRWLCYPMR